MPNGPRSKRDSQPIHIPARLTNVHPAVAASRDQLSRSVTPHMLRRMLLAMQGLALEAERRGLTVASPSDTKSVLVIGRGSHSYAISIREANDRVDHVPAACELRDAERWSWSRPRQYDYVPSGRLVLELPAAYGTARHKWADGTRWTLEQKLGDVLVEIGARVEADEAKRLDQMRIKEERKARWQDAMDTARDRYVEDRRGRALVDQAVTWQRVRLIREYCEALEQRIEGLTATEAEPSRAWLDWAQSYVDGLDPLAAPPPVPLVRPASPDDLREFLDCWSPHGP